MEKDIMKKKILIISSILILLFIFIGQGFVAFYLGGKEEILKTAAIINNLCNASNSCPVALEGWHGENGKLRKGQMLYMTTPIPGSGNNETNLQPQSFRLIYVMSFPTDDWFEVQGGVGKKITSGWTGR